jgi:hypothetical protein
LVIVDELYHEDIWYQWIEKYSTNEIKAKLYIHAKYPDRIRSNWVRQHLIQQNYEPEWNSPEVVRAMNACLEEALMDTSSVRFMIGT